MKASTPITVALKSLVNSPPSCPIKWERNSSPSRRKSPTALVARFRQAEGVSPLKDVWTGVDHFNN